MLHGLAGDHQTVLTDVGGIDLGHGGVAVGDEVTETALIHGLESSTGIVGDVTGLCEDEGIHIADDGSDLGGPGLQVSRDLGNAPAGIGIVLVGVAGDGVTLFPPSIGDLLGTGFAFLRKERTRGLKRQIRKGR